MSPSAAGPEPAGGRRIAFVSWRDLAHPQAGGSEVLTDHLATACLERGHQVGLMCGSPTAPRGYEVVPLGGAYGQYLRAPIVHARRFRDWDVLVDIDNGIPFFSPLWRRGPIVCLVHHLSAEQWRLRFPRPVAAFGRTLEDRAMPYASIAGRCSCAFPRRPRPPSGSWGCRPSGSA